MLNFISNHPFQNKVAIIKNLVDRAICLSHKSFHSENLDFVRKILFFNHYPRDLIEKHIKIRIEQVKSRMSSNVDTDTQSEIFDKHNTKGFSNREITISYLYMNAPLNFFNELPMSKR